MAQKFAHPAELHLRIAPRQNLHDLIAAHGGDVFEALDERRRYALSTCGTEIPTTAARWRRCA